MNESNSFEKIVFALDRSAKSAAIALNQLGKACELLKGREIKSKRDAYSLDVASLVYQELVRRRRRFLPSQVIRKITKRLPISDYQREEAIKHLQGGFVANRNFFQNSNCLKLDLTI